MMFAALALLSAMALILYFIADAGLRRLIFWQTEQEGTVR